MTARTGETHVRDQIADRDLEAWLVVDVSAAMRFGTAKLEKAQVALAAAACVGFLTVRNKNRIGAALVAGPHIKMMPPRFGRDQVRAILTAVASPPPSEHLGRSDLAGAISRVDRLSRRRGFVCVIADFAGSAWADPLTRLGMRNDLLAIPIHDPRERDVPPIGLVSLVDAATGATREVRVTAGIQRRFAEARGHESGGAARRLAPCRRRHHRAAHRQRLARGDHPARAPATHPGRQRSGSEAPGMNLDFLEPQRLWLLVGVAALGVAYLAVLRWRSTATVRFTAVDLLDEIVPRRPRWRRHVVAGMQLLGLAAGVVAIARPISTTTERVVSEGRIVLALDTSLSMEATDVAPSRLAAAQQAATDFVDQVADDVEIGVVSFSGVVAVEAQPTLNRTAVDNAHRRA